MPLLPGAHSPQEKGAFAPRELDTFILGIVRYQVGCSARFNDLQHTAPSTLKHTTTTLEFSAWQTKTVSAARIRKHPVPLICPKYSFTGHAWWQPLLTSWTRLSKHPSFEESDYLIPTISKDGMGFIARPGQADRTLRWLKDALGRRGGSPRTLPRPHMAQLPCLHSRLCLSTRNFPRSKEVLGELDDRINSRCLYQGEAQCSGQGMA